MAHPLPPPPGRLATGTRLAVIRHGEAVCNTADVIGGHEGCTGLTEHGRRQVERLAERLERTGELASAVALYTSVLRRARESAEVVARTLKIPEIVSTCTLCERHPGEADGMTWSAYQAAYQRSSFPGDDPDVALSPGGESWATFLDRAAASLEAVAAAHPGELVVVVAHGGVIDASMIRFLGIPRHGGHVRLHPEHTSITEWEYTGLRWRLARYNDASHLAELRTPVPLWVRDDLARQEALGLLAGAQQA